MDAEKNPAESKANDKSVALWRMILLGLCAAGVVLLAGILVMQFAEYRFYKAAPNVWPQPGAAGMVSAPVASSVKPSPVTAAISSAAPAAVSAPAPAMAATSAPVAAAVSTSAPAAIKP